MSLDSGISPTASLFSSQVSLSMSMFSSSFALVCRRLILGALLSVLGILTAVPVSVAAEPGIAWVGMFPVGFSENAVIEGQPFQLYAQVYKPGVTETIGRGRNIQCSLYWSPVPDFGRNWRRPTEVFMTFNGDIGNNDEYVGTVTLEEGRYELSTSCTDLETGKTTLHKGGNARLTVYSMPTDRRALWVDQATIAWNSFGGVYYELHVDPNGELKVPVRRGSGIPLTFSRTLEGHSYPKFPNISGYDAWTIPASRRQRVPDMLRGEVAIASYDSRGDLVDTTGLQLQGVLDDLYSYAGDLGLHYVGDVPTLKLWAPTAKSVTLQRFADSNSSTAGVPTPMNFDPATGVWSVTGDPSWNRQYYLYEVDVYTPFTGQIERNLSTDPYSVSLSQGSLRSQFIDLYNDPALKPRGWDTLQKPPYLTPEDMAIYEVHVRDFSRDDVSVAPDHRGKFKAFTYDGQQGRRLSNGMAHLRALAEAGLTHIHLLPSFDYTSVNEDPILLSDPDYDTLGSLDRDSSLQQAIIAVSRGNDSFNWGFDPWHYGVPEGSYATVADGPSRIFEFRELVQALANNGLRVVMGVVYNHTFANVRYSQSVLDKIVPGYYYRYTNSGYQHSSSCCPDTAMEFDMMQKLMIDTIIRWIKAYKVDGFRFDLMNLHTVNNMKVLQATINDLTLEQDGVNGNQIYLYGEGWDFGSARDKGLYYANQYNISGTGIGTFNDKIRDAAHGGSSGDPIEARKQGFINGLSYDWNGFFYANRFKRDLRQVMDKLRVALAGSLRTFEVLTQYDFVTSGIQLEGTGYALDPQETVNYVSKHDNETLFDLNVLKLPLGEYGTGRTQGDERARVQNMGLSLVGLSQGVPFFQLGGDMLRSKSLDRNSYDSGDWFNRVDFTYQTNNFGVGLPPAWDNRARWGIMAPLLTNRDLNPAPSQIRSTVAHLQDILKIRKSSKLFRMETASDIQQRIRFHNVGSFQRDALIVMSINDNQAVDLDPDHELIVVLFNANKTDQTFRIPALTGKVLALHPVQRHSEDPVVKMAQFNSSQGDFFIPARTTAVFVSDETL